MVGKCFTLLNSDNSKYSRVSRAHSCFRTLDLLTGGRMLLGLGVSGPQVVEGWHGVAYGKPLVRTREYVEAGGLMSYGESARDFNRRAAFYVVSDRGSP